MTIDVEEVLRRGGKGLLDLLSYSVFSVQLEPLFVFLAGEFRQAPTAAKALALNDLFCAPGAPGRLRTYEVLEPRELRLRRALDPIREAAARPAPAEDEGEEMTPPVPIPAAHLFDFLVAQLQGLADGPLQQVARQYDPDKTPAENLPGGKMSAGQRSFV